MGIHETIALAIGDTAVDRSALIDRLDRLDIDRALAARAIGKMVSLGKLIEDADGRVSVNTAWEPGSEPRKKRKKQKAPEPEPAGQTVIADESFRPALAHDGALLIFGVLQDHGILEFTLEQTQKIRGLLTLIPTAIPRRIPIAVCGERGPELVTLGGESGPAKEGG